MTDQPATRQSPDKDLWTQILEVLSAGTVTKATFDAWLRDTTAKQQGGILTVSVANTYALDWLDNRLRSTIERIARNVADDELEIKFEVTNGETTYQPELFFQGSYRDAYNELVQANRPSHYSSWYFHRAWLPLLGPELWVLLWEMRTRCYWNKETGVKRDTFEATYNELGAATGMSRAKAYRLLNPKEETKKAILQKFILNQETKKRFSKGRGGMVNEKTIWQIRLDDPLTPDDEEKLAKGL